MTRRNLIQLAAFGSFALLAGAFVFQMLGYAPCKLCLWQRWPHGAAIVLGLAAVFVSWRALPWLGAAAAMTTGAIGFYHTGVERGIFEGPDTCTSNGVGGLTAEELLEQIMAAPLIRCDEVAWSMLGLSMASWNMIISFGLALVWIIAATRPANG